MLFKIEMKGDSMEYFEPNLTEFSAYHSTEKAVILLDGLKMEVKKVAEELKQGVEVVVVELKTV